MKKIQTILALALCPLLLASCYLDETPDAAPILGYRTVLFYLAADSDLSEGIDESQQRIEALHEFWCAEVGLGGHLLVYQDSRKQPSRLIEILPAINDLNGVNLKPVRDSVIVEYGEGNSASSTVFSRAIGDMCSRYPSMNYGMVVFSHSSGWLPASMLATPRSVVENPAADTRTVTTDQDNEFELRAFASSIPDGLFSFIAFESCLMAGIEVAYELKDKADYLIASSTELVAPGFTPVYRLMVPELFKAYPYYNSAAEFYFNYANGLTGDNRSATISVIRTSKLAPVRKLLRQAESRVINLEALNRKGIQSFDRRTDGHLFYDLADYMALIGTPEESLAFSDSLAKAVVYRAATPGFMPGSSGGFAITRHCGMTIYIPDAHYPQLNKERRLLKLHQ